MRALPLIRVSPERETQALNMRFFESHSNDPYFNLALEKTEDMAGIPLDERLEFSLELLQVERYISGITTGDLSQPLRY